MTSEITRRINQDTGVSLQRINATIRLIQDGATIPFIARFRREATGNLDETHLRQIAERYIRYGRLAERRAEVLAAVEGHPRLTPELREQIEQCEVPEELEDLYLAFRPKRQSKSSLAKRRGLEELADYILTQSGPPAAEEIAPRFISSLKKVPDAATAIEGALHIVAERVSENADYRRWLRNFMLNEGTVQVKAVKDKQEQKTKYSMYYDFAEPVARIPSHRMLAIRRGAREKILSYSIQIDDARALAELRARNPIQPLLPSADLIDFAITDSYERLLKPVIQNEVREILRLRSEDEAITVFEENLSALLLAPPAGRVTVLGLEPNQKGGQRLAVVGPDGALLEHHVVRLGGARAPGRTTAREEKPRADRADSDGAPGEAASRSASEPGSRTVELAAHRTSVELSRTDRSAIPPVNRAAPDPVITGPEEPPPDHVAVTPPAAQVRVTPQAAGDPPDGDTERMEAAAGAAEGDAGEPSPFVPETGSTSSESVESSPTADIRPDAEGTPPQAANPEPDATGTPEEAPPGPALSDRSSAETSAPEVSGTRASASGGASPGGPGPAPDPEALLVDIVKRRGVRGIVIGNGSGSRQAEAFVRSAIARNGLDVFVVVTNEAGAGVYAASQPARQELPNVDSAIRSAVSIARRLQDPLAELVKIDPKSIGVGQYQHDVDQEKLRTSLWAAVESAVNRVGVELNDASKDMLQYVAGLSDELAEAIVRHRRTAGPFSTLDQLRQVDGVDDRVFAQAAGFLRLSNGAHPLDRTFIHPESYPVVEKLAGSIGARVEDVVGNAEQVRAIKFAEFDAEAGHQTLGDIRQELLHPGRDPRKRFVVPRFRDDVHDIGDLKEGMELEGTVTNVTNFGAFVDIGVHQDGLVHISELSYRYVSDARQAAQVGDVVKVKVLGVDAAQTRISLSVKATLPKPQPRRKVVAEASRPRPPAEGANQRSRRPRSQEAAAPARRKPRRGAGAGSPPTPPAPTRQLSMEEKIRLLQEKFKSPGT